MNSAVVAGPPPPTAPANVTATASGGKIALNWTASQDAIGVSSYVVKREDPGSTSFVQIGTATGTSYSDAGLTAGSTYNYEVQAVDWAGNQSAVSNVASSTTTSAGNPGLVAAYAFSEGAGTTVSDLSGNGHNGAVVNATWSTAGKYGD